MTTNDQGPRTRFESLQSRARKLGYELKDQSFPNVGGVVPLFEIYENGQMIRQTLGIEAMDCFLHGVEIGRAHREPVNGVS